MHPFKCTYQCLCGNIRTWDGNWEFLWAGDEIEELRIRSRGKIYNVILGMGKATEYFLCIPNKGVGIDADSFEDLASIRYRLRDVMSPEDAETVMSALKDYFS